MTARPRILFVDDEQALLDGLRMLMRREVARWDMEFVQNGRLALEEMRRHHYDLLVTDMRMPEMDGATLLEAVRAEFPATVQIVLTGDADGHLLARACVSLFRLLEKPCAPSVLRATIASALETVTARPKRTGTD